MANIIFVIAICMAIAISVFVFVNSAPSVIANTLRLVFPILLIAFGIVGIYVGRIAYGTIPLGLGILLLAFNWPAIMRSRAGARIKPVVRSVSIELVMDPWSTTIDGFVLTGKWEGAALSKIAPEELLELHLAFQEDQESTNLLEAYLDCRIPAWREDTQAYIDARLDDAERSGPMTEQEAYQILGLKARARRKHIASAHRRLMKLLAATSVNNRFLVSCIDQAKDTLLKEG